MPDWVAVNLSTGHVERRFATEREAWDHVFSRMCRDCKDERARVLAGEGKPETDEAYGDSEYPDCSAEWIVLPGDGYDAAEGLEGLFTAAGFVRVEKAGEPK